MIMSLLPIIAIDIYGLLKYHWGGQFYIVVIETLLLSIVMILFQLYEMKKVDKIIIQDALNYSPVHDESADERVLDRIG